VDVDADPDANPKPNTNPNSYPEPNPNPIPTPIIRISAGRLHNWHTNIFLPSVYKCRKHLNSSY